jgi:alkylhydroperoxidase family enzyme
MTHISPLPREAITDPELLELMAQAESLGVPDDTFVRLIARAPAQAKPTLRAMLLSFTQGNVDHRLKEIVRILLARFANDKYFASLRSRKARAAGLTEQRIDEGVSQYEDDAKGFSEAEKCALRFADLMYLNANQIDKAFYDEMKKHWSEAQIMELGSFITCHYAMQMFMRSMGAKGAGEAVARNN